MRRLFVYALIAGLAACGGNSTSPTAPPSTVPPTPAPTPSPNPFAAACGNPLPPFADSYGFGIKVQLEPSDAKKIINASPIIKNAEYCAAAGFLGHTICNTRKEDNPERPPCDHYLSGIADTGKPGPNWFEQVGGQLVKCGEPGTHCELKPENQYLLDVYSVGKYVACGGKGSPGTCGVCILLTFDRNHKSTGGLCTLD